MYRGAFRSFTKMERKKTKQKKKEEKIYVSPPQETCRDGLTQRGKALALECRCSAETHKSLIAAETRAGARMSENALLHGLRLRARELAVHVHLHLHHRRQLR